MAPLAFRPRVLPMPETSVNTPDDRPLVTIIVPAYNRAGGLLEQTLDSILEQDYPNLEVLAIDDGSSDHTPQVLEEYAQLWGERIRIRVHENMGQARTLNVGFDMARGEIIGYLNSDDIFLPGAISKLAQALIDDPELALAYPAYKVIDEDNLVAATMTPPQYEVAEAVRLHNCIVNVGAVFRRRVLDEIGGWDPSFIYLADFDWCVRAASVGPFKLVPEPLACWRTHPGSANYAPGLEAAREQARLLDKIFSVETVPQELLEIKEEAYRNAYVVAAYAMGGINSDGGRFFVHDTLAREVSSRMPDTDAELNARMRKRLVNLERREQRLTEAIERLQAGESLDDPRWRRALRRITPPGLRPLGRRVLRLGPPAAALNGSRVDRGIDRELVGEETGDPARHP
jgi:glycosyltransferase involved in cell wall biosynthesis